MTPGGNGARLIQAIASSRDFTWMIQKPAMSSFDSVNGPSFTDVLPPAANAMRAALDVGWSPSPASMTPAFTSSSLNLPIVCSSSPLGS